MKFTKFLTLLTATAVLSHSVPEKRQEQEKIEDNNIENLREGSKTIDIPDISNIDLTQLSQLDLSFIGIKKNEECDKAIEEYKTCFVGTNKIEEGQKDTVCNNFNSEKCQSLFKNGIKGVKGCENLEDLLYNIEEFLVEANSVSLKMQCAKDENGQYCPLSNFSTQVINQAVNKNDTVTDEETKTKYTEAVNSTCKSRTCIDAALEFETGSNKLKSDVEEFKKQIEGIINFMGAAQDMPMFNPRAKFAFTLDGITDENMINKTSEYLRSDECTAQAPKKEDSSATTIKLGGLLLSALATVFIIFA